MIDDIACIYSISRVGKKKVIDLDFGKMYGTQTYRSINRPS